MAYGSTAIGQAIRLPPLPTIRDLVKLYNLRAIKQLSQNFLMDERLTDKIVKNMGKIANTDTVLEVGPGPGGITRSILRRNPKRLILVEKDERFLPTLELLKECSQPLGIDVEIHAGDILKFPIEEVMSNDSSRLHLDLSERKGAFRRTDTMMTLTFQKEVAERICAPIGNEQRCRLSIMSQVWTQPVFKFLIPGRAFVPKPEVDVGVVRLIPLKQPKTNIPFTIVERVMRHIFSMRQKFCRRGYSTLFPENMREDATEDLFYKADVQSTLRPYQLSIDECLRLAQCYYDFIRENPEIGEYNYRAPKSLQATYASPYQK